MAMRTLGEALESALASMLNEVGGEVAGTRLDAVKLPKGTGTEAPAKSKEEIVHPQQQPERTAPRATQPGKAPASPGNAKGRRAHPHELAPLGARQPLVLVVNNGPHVRQPRPGTPALRVAWSNRSTKPDATRRTRPDRGNHEAAASP